MADCRVSCFGLSSSISKDHDARFKVKQLTVRDEIKRKIIFTPGGSKRNGEFTIFIVKPKHC